MKPLLNADEYSFFSLNSFFPSNFKYAAVLMLFIFLFSSGPSQAFIGEKLFRHANELQKKGDTKGAAEYYKKALKILPDSSQLKKKAQKALDDLQGQGSKKNTPAGNIDKAGQFFSLPESLRVIRKKELEAVHQAVQADFSDFFEAGVSSLEKSDFDNAQKLLSPLVFIPVNSYTRGRINYLLGIINEKLLNNDKALDYYINGVLDYPILSNIRTFGFRTLLDNAVKNIKESSRHDLLISVQAFVDKKTDIAVKAFKLIKEKDLNFRFRKIYYKLKSAIGLNALLGSETIKTSLLLKSMELKADNSFKRGDFEKSLKQYEYLHKKNPDSPALSIKIKAAQELLKIEDLILARDKAFSDLAKIYPQEVYSLPFTAFKASQLSYEELLECIGKKDFSRSYEIIEALLSNAFLAGTMSKVMYQKSIVDHYSKRPVKAAENYCLSVLMNKDILAHSDRGILKEVLGIKDLKKFDSPLAPQFFRALDFLVKNSLNPGRQVCQKLLDNAKKENNYKFMIYGIWLLNVFNIEMGMNIVKGSVSLKGGSGSAGHTASGPMGDLERIPVKVKNAPARKQATWRYGELPDPDNEPGDFDGDGIVSSKDLKILRKIIAGQFRSMPEACEVADVNADGEINKDDYNLAVWKYNKSPGDFDGDGIISMEDINVIRLVKDELKKITVPFETLHSTEQERLKELQKKADINNDGKFDAHDYNDIMTYRRYFIGTRQF
jgi:tetratricopeptide (TPR) repeat protein